MTFEYQHTTPEARDAVAASLTAEPAQPEVTPAMLAAWELDHHAHCVLEEQARADGDEEKAAEHRAACEAIESALAAATPAQPTS